MKMTHALICIDFINEMVGVDGKLAQKGYLDFCQRHKTLEHLAQLQAETRNSGGKVIHVHLGFASDYADHPAHSLLIGGARNAGILKIGSQSATIHPNVQPHDEDILLIKRRISAFYDTGLATVLSSLGVTSVTIAGVSTDLAVQSAARDAHDRDFKVTVVANSCAAASDEDHENALSNISKFATVTR
jgi:nicotinamidase-related amidase